MGGIHAHYNNIINTVVHFFFNHVITWFDVPKDIVSYDVKHFENETFQELYELLFFPHDFSSPFYPEANS